MIGYVAHKLRRASLTLFGASLITFIIIQLPPGDFLSTMISECEARGESNCADEIEVLKEAYHLNDPMWQQYLYWVGSLLKGDMSGDSHIIFYFDERSGDAA